MTTTLFTAAFSLSETAPIFQCMFLIHFTSAVYMTGVIWFLQAVHYPLFQLVAPVEFYEYHRRHTGFTGWVTVPGGVAELVSGIFLVLLAPSILFYPVFAFAVLLLVLDWGVGGVMSETVCRRLRREGNGRRTISSLLLLNWFRTIARTLRCALLGWMILKEFAA